MPTPSRSSFRAAAAFGCLVAFGLFLYTAIVRVSPGEATQRVGAGIATPAQLAAQPYTPPAVRPTVVQRAARARTVTASRSEFPLGDPHRFGLMWPVTYRDITSPFGPRDGGFHHGTDIGCPIGTPVRAAQTGRVLFAGDGGPYGLVVLLDHGGGLQTLYAHLSKISVKVGEIVARERWVGRSGQTGNATGPHLHFEVRYGGYVWDPLTFLP